MVEKKKSAKAAVEYKWVSALEALKARREDIVVKASKEIEVSPDGEYARHFQHVEMRTFKDLQRMSLIPEGLVEKNVRDAIARDDEAAFEAAQRAPWSGDADCGCADGREGPAASRNKSGYADSLRARLTDVRRNYNVHLARNLTEVYGRDVQWHSAVAVHVYRAIERLRILEVVRFPSLLIKDITVNQNATLVVASGTQLVWANKVRIHVGGKITSTGSYLKLKCASVEGNLP